ncbi:DNA-binding protein [Sedimenticola sp.]|uniref:DNA-binding protein n=1 Tax=Sedimenticola sp. TaxID=1940285 RepID=UPI003D113793
MSLENLLKIGQLKRHQTDREEIRRLLDSARRNLADAGIEAVSHENRFHAAYTAIMQCALAAMMASGYRPDTKKPGHHMTLIQSLSLTMGLQGKRIVLLEAFRKKRNLTDYDGGFIEEGVMHSAMGEARRLLEDVENWLAKEFPYLFVERC